MLTRHDLIDAAPRLGLEHAHNRKDFTNGIGTGVIRGVYQGQRAVALSGQTGPMCDALLDLLAAASPPPTSGDD